MYLSINNNVQFAVDRERFNIDAEERVTCLLLKGVEHSDECIFGYTFAIEWYIIIGSVLPFSGIGSLVLSCNDKNYLRWIIMFRTLKDFCLCKTNKHNEHMIFTWICYI